MMTSQWLAIFGEHTLDQRGDRDSRPMEVGLVDFRGLEEARCQLIQAFRFLVDQSNHFPVGCVELSVLEQAGTGGTNGGEGRFESVSKGIQHRGPELFALASGLRPALAVEGPCPLQSDRRKRGDGIQRGSIEFSSANDDRAYGFRSQP